jgi:hypothetical protein
MGDSLPVLGVWDTHSRPGAEHLYVVRLNTVIRGWASRRGATAHVEDLIRREGFYCD